MLRYWSKLLLHLLIPELLAMRPRAVKYGIHTDHKEIQHHKKKLIYGIWSIATLLMLTNPVLPIILIIALPATFLSFVILDENTF
ncbi:hypothetical protein [Endozoicomonas sp. Mp262]|uniref:hypothetical protein n=1 Tax=Endozoicomonas sp. Mp262 TaxID=2919499 RepID=UPI0021DA2E17